MPLLLSDRGSHESTVGCPLVEPQPRPPAQCSHRLAAVQRLIGPHPVTAGELKACLDAERTGPPFLVLRDGDLTHRLIMLDGAATMTVGRSLECDLALPWDQQV
jgi:hypothetical protein